MATVFTDNDRGYGTMATVLTEKRNDRGIKSSPQALQTSEINGIIELGLYNIQSNIHCNGTRAAVFTDNTVTTGAVSGLLTLYTS